MRKEQDNIIIAPPTQQLAKFLRHIGLGEQDDAESMLKVNCNLASVPGNFTDCAEKQFNQVTGFQYAVWALDWHMWTMITKYMPTYAVKEQLIKLDTEGIDVREAGVSDYTKCNQISWKCLIEALHTYLINHGKLDDRQCSTFWCQQVGGAQLTLPAHVINEYNRPDRSFYLFPTFNESILPRTGCVDWMTKKGNLGIDFAWWRGGNPDKACPDTDWNGIYMVDHQALSSLFDIRTEQRAKLISSVAQTPDRP